MAVPELTGFDQVTFRHEGRTHQVYRAGRGPAVIVIHEIPGLHPSMVTFAQRLIAPGYTILIVWAVELMDHAGILPGAGHWTGLRYS